MNGDAKFENLKNAPITEALIDIQVRFQTPPSGEVLKSVSDAVSDEFPNIEERQRATFSVGSETEPSIQQKSHGLIVRSEDRVHALQIMPDRFAFSRLKPYSNWDELKANAERIWLIYRDITKPERIARLSVRFINKLPIPMPIQDFGEYFTKPIEVPKELPQGLSSYVIRMVIPDPVSQSVATIHQILEGSTPENQLSIIFDIDVHKLVDFPPEESNDLSQMLEILRDYKNRIFFNSLTQKTLNLFR